MTEAFLFLGLFYKYTLYYKYCFIRHREELHPIIALIRTTIVVAPCIGVDTAVDPHVGAYRHITLPSALLAPPRGDDLVVFQTIQSNYIYNIGCKHPNIYMVRYMVVFLPLYCTKVLTAKLAPLLYVKYNEILFAVSTPTVAIHIVTIKCGKRD